MGFMKDVPRSNRFDDVYFSVEDGFCETYHVFLQGNDLPNAWQDKDQFVICETGFGTGLNFLSAWKLFEETRQPGQFLDFISFEKYPLEPDFIRQALQPWAHHFGDLLEKFLQQYPMLVPGYHRLVFDECIALTLIFDDVNDAIPDVVTDVDCWFLDGFTPAKNPDMWTSTLFENMARLSKKGASFATFTAAGDVKRGLQAAGFEVEKRPGFARKRDMLVGRYAGDASSVRRSEAKSKIKTIAIIGAGLAGTSCAHILRQYGFKTILYDRAEKIASAASGNPIGIYNPRISALRSPESDFYASAFALTHRVLNNFEDIHHKACGAIHLINSEEKEKRFHKTSENWGWPDDHMRIVDAGEASDIAGVAIEYEALYLPNSGYVSPQKLCENYSDDVEFRALQDITDLDQIDSDIVILANGFAAKIFFEHIPIDSVRGQISYAQQNDASAKVKTNICFGGYISAPSEGRHIIGSSFQRWLDHTDIIEQDHIDSIERLENYVPSLKGLSAYDGRAGLRSSSKDRFPIIGEMPDYPRIFLSLAHGSHGIVSSLLGAHILADYLRGGPMCLSQKSLYALSLKRFADRESKKT